MKLFCFFISFVVVNVLGDQLADYMEKIAIINSQIELVNNRPEVSLETVITQFVCGNASMEKISVMFAVPGLAIIENCEKCENSKTCKISRMELQKYMDYQIELQNAITSVLNEDSSDVKGKKCDDSDDTDETEDNSDVKGKSIDDSDFKDKNKQIELQGCSGDYDVKDENEGNSDVKGKSIDDSDFKDKMKLSELIRKMSYGKVSIDEACQNKLLALGNARRILIVKAIQVLLFIKASERDGDFSVPTRMCRLRGLYKSVDAPEWYIINARADAHRNHCFLTANGNPNIMFYEYIYIRQH